MFDLNNNFVNSVSPCNANFSSVISSSNFDSYDAKEDFMSFKQDPLVTPTEMESMSQPIPPNLPPEESSSDIEANKIEIRRKKNRESAARSRKKIKDKLETLEQSMSQLKDRKAGLVNERDLLNLEIRKLQNQLLDFKVTDVLTQELVANPN